jgi:hypothetical protein
MSSSSTASVLAPGGSASLAATPESSQALSLPPPVPFTGGIVGFEHDTRGKFQLDSRGIVLTHNPLGPGWYYNPTAIAHYVQGLYGAWMALPPDQRAGSPLLDKMRVNAGWLDRNMRSFPDGHGRSIYIYPFPVSYDLFNAPVGWRSALSAANAMTALVEAGAALNEPQLIQDSARLLPAFDLPTGLGGYRVPLGPHAAWFEEYSTSGHPTPRVLNGHMYALGNLNWYATYTHNATAARLFLEGINGLYQSLHLYNSTPTSLYDLMRRGHLLNYHRAHVQLLQYLYEVTGIPRFAQYARQWARETSGR